MMNIGLKPHLLTDGFQEIVNVTGEVWYKCFVLVVFFFLFTFIILY